MYCVKSVQIRSFFYSVFGHFSRSDSYSSHLKSLTFIEDTPSSQFSLGSGPARLIPKILLPPKSFLLWLFENLLPP